MLNKELLEKFVTQNQKQSALNKEMFELSNTNLNILQGVNDKIYTKLYEFKDKDVPAEVTNEFLRSFTTLFDYYNQFLNDYNEKLSNQMGITMDTTKTITEGYSE